ncbi:MAG: tRNA pseudouridine(13) synthase TruD [Phycisphaerales bacterium]
MLDRSHHVVPQSYLTADIPGVGGVIKQRPEDFLVDEQPQYQPSGEGEHVYLLVQKRGMSTLDMTRVIARHFGVRPGAVGFAGLKDKHAVTRQIISVHTPGKKHTDFPMLQHEQVAILWADQHNNKLRPGHLAGNRFSIRIRNVEPTRVRDAHRVLQRLAATGVPNRFGEQRFGMLANNHLIGRALVLGDFDEAVRELLGPSAARPDFNKEARELFVQKKYREAIHAYPMQAHIETRVLNQLDHGRDARAALLCLDETTIRFYLSAFQSAVFNSLLDERLADNTLGSLHEGDVAIKHANLACFQVDAPTATDPATTARLASFEISPSGPMWAAGMMRASGDTDAREVAALARLGLTPEQLEVFTRASRFDLEGKRRPFRVPLLAPEVEGGVDEHGPYIRCAFELPRGAFATVALREVMKPAEGLGDED